MKNANEMAKLVQSYDEKTEMKKRARLFKFCNGRIARKVERKAKIGVSATFVRVPKRISKADVYRILTDRDYKVITCTNGVRVLW